MSRRWRAPGRTRTALWIARRYLLAKGHGYATFINWISFVGLALGVMILTVVLSVMNGFDREITGRLLTAMPHVLVTPRNGGAPRLDRLRGLEGVARVERYFQAQAMLTRGGAVNFLAIAGFDAADAPAMSRLLPRDALDALLAAPGGIVLGANLADAVGLRVGEPVVLVFSKPQRAGVRPMVARLRLAGTFSIGATPDATLGVVLRDDILRRGLADAGVDGWRLRLRDPFAAPAMVAAVRDAAGADAEARFWMEDYGALFRAVKIEKAMMFALLGLIVAIAAFNIVSGQAMLVNDKRGDTALLTTLGAPRGFLVGIFFLQGFGVAFLGVATGLAAGVLVAQNANAVLGLLQGMLGANIIDGTWFAEVPSRVQAADLAAIAGLGLGLSALAVAWPALKATRENPADALHSA